MLREHGSQRPTVFELLDHVHRLRGSKSKFTYNIPAPPPLVSRPQAHAHAKAIPSPHPLEGTISYVSPPAKSALSLYDPKSLPNPPAMNPGIQARDKVLEAIGPMRRGRPNTSQNPPSRSSSPQKNGQAPQDNQDALANWPDANQERAWRNAREKQTESSKEADDGWNLNNLDKRSRPDKIDQSAGFGDDFSEKLWSASDPNSTAIAPLQPKLSPRPNIMNIIKTSDVPVTPLAFTGTTMLRVKPDRLQQNRDKDAFEGLGLMTSTTKAPTLGEAVGARKLRTGLASMGMSSTYDRDRARTNAVPRPTPSPQSKFLSPTQSTGATTLQPKPISPVPTPNSSSSSYYKSSPYSPSGAGASPVHTTNSDGMPVESRFPSLEELDAQFSPPAANALYPSSVNDASAKFASAALRQTGTSRPQYNARASNIGIASSTGGSLLKPTAALHTNYSVDGVRSQQVTGMAMREPKESKRHGERSNPSDISDGVENLSLKDSQNAVPIKPAFASGKFETKELPNSHSGPSNDSLNSPPLPKRPAANNPPRDWLTGEDMDDMKSTTSAEVPILRESPSKRASFIETSEFTIPPFSAAQHVYVSERPAEETRPEGISPTVSKFTRDFPALEALNTQNSPLQSNSDGLTENWSPLATRREIDGESSSADEGPEDPGSKPAISEKAKRPVKGRQSSVHDLVFQYGGGVAPKEKEKEKEYERQRVPALHNVGDYKDHRPVKPYKPAGLAPPNISDLDRKSSSPTNQTIQLPPVISDRSPRLQSTNLTDKPLPPVNGTKSPSSARSRPQSMFIFPTKSIDSSSSSSVTLAPPEEPMPRASRRTSISDMVQRYEAIGSSVKSPISIPPGPPSPIHRPVTAKSNSTTVSSHKIFPSQSKPIPAKKSVSSNITGRVTTEPLKAVSPSSLEPSHQSHSVALNRTPTKSHSKKPTSDNNKDRPAPAVTPDRTISRPRRMSSRADPPVSSSPMKVETTVAAGLRKLSIPAQSVNPPDSPRKPVIPLKSEEPSSRTDERSPSPERPYQGVGRLIDQWQKKSAEAAQPVVKRADLKRTGIVRGGDR